MPGVTTAYQSGNHAGRPANGAGCILYSCTTHSLIYRDDGTSWTTFLTLPGAGLSDQGTATYLDWQEGAAPGTPAATKARLYVKSDGRFYSKDDAGTEYGPFDTAGGGGYDSGYIAAKTADTGITAYWPLNEGAGTTYADAVGSADLTALATTPGFGPSLSRDAAGGSLHIPSTTWRVGRAALTWGATFTLEGWVVSSGLAEGFVFGQWNGAGAMLSMLSGNLSAYSGGTATTHAPTNAEKVGRHHIAMTHDGTQVRMYLDGVLIAGPTTLALQTTNQGGAFRLGTYSDTTSVGTALYSDIAFYSGRALSAADLLGWYNLGA